MKKILFSQGEEALKSNKFKKALTIFQELIKLEPQNAAAYQGASISLHNLGKYDDAIEMCGKALKIDRNLVTPHVILAYIYDELGEREKSREEAKISFSINPESSEVLSCLGILSLVEGDLDESLNYLEKAVKINRSDYLAQYNLAVVYQTKHDTKKLYKQAVTLFRLKSSIKNLLRLTYLTIRLYRFIDLIVLLVAILLLPLFGSKFIFFVATFWMFVYFIAGLFVGFAEKERKWKDMMMMVFGGLVRWGIGFCFYFFAKAFLG